MMLFAFCISFYNGLTGFVGIINMTVFHYIAIIRLGIAVLVVKVFGRENIEAVFTVYNHRQMQSSTMGKLPAVLISNVVGNHLPRVKFTAFFGWFGGKACKR